MVLRRPAGVAAAHESKASTVSVLLALVACCIGQPAQEHGLRCKPTLTAVKQVSTAGSAGWEFWEHGGQHYLATANFWVRGSLHRLATVHVHTGVLLQ